MATSKRKSKTPKEMVTARIEFKEGSANQFCEGPQQTVVEMKFESAQALVDTLRELECYISNCTAFVDGRVVDLRNLSGL